MSTSALLKACSIALLLSAAILPACDSTGQKDFDAMVNGIIHNAETRRPEDVAADLFDTGTPDARRAAIAIIQKKSWGHEPPYMKAYRVLATDPEPLVRGQAYRALGSSHQPGVAADLAPATDKERPLPGLITGLDDSDVSVRRDVAEAMCDVKNDAMVDPLIDHLRKDPDAQVRISCTRALAGYDSPRALRALAEALDDKDVAVIQYAYKALTATTGQQFEKAPKPWMEYINARYPATRPGAS